MKMPKGWKKLESFAYELGRDYCTGSNDVNDALVLMKEMAAALEKGLKYEDCPVKEKCRIYGHDEMRNALTKFKEWK